jgi:large subunit ribosomal protein L13
MQPDGIERVATRAYVQPEARLTSSATGTSSTPPTWCWAARRPGRDLLRGKHKPTYAPHVDGGDFVIVVNASKVALSGDKPTKKLAYRHSGYPGGLSVHPVRRAAREGPAPAIEKSVWGMLPKNRSAGRCSTSSRCTPARAPAPRAEGQPFEITQISQ